MSGFIKQFSQAVGEFAKEREWEQFHTPRQLTAAISIEAAELQEIFLWQSDSQSAELTEEQLASLRDEIADVQIYLMMLAQKSGIDIEAACWEKMEKNRSRYPVDLAKGTAKKYTQL